MVHRRFNIPSSDLILVILPISIKVFGSSILRVVPRVSAPLLCILLLFVHRVSLLSLLERVVDNQFFGDILTQHEDSVFLSDYQFGFPVLRWVRVDVRIIIVNGTGESVKSQSHESFLEQKFEKFFEGFVDLLFWHVYLPKV